MEAAAVRLEKEKVLDCVRLERNGVLDLALTTARGRYEAGFQGGLPVRGYLEEDGVAADSRTETFAALRLEIANRRWAGVPFYLRAGKRLTRRSLRSPSFQAAAVPAVRVGGHHCRGSQHDRAADPA